MMQKLRPVLLVAVCIVLAALVWLDYAPDGTQQRDTRQLPAEVPPPVATGQDDSDVALERAQTTSNPSDTQDMNPSHYQTDRTETDPTEEANAGARQVNEGGITNPLSSVEVGQLNETVERPLFAPLRQRPPPREAGASAAPPQEDSFDLLGVALGGSRPIAIIRKKSDGKSFRVEVGDTLGVWHVTKVDPREVHLERNGGEPEIVRLLRK